MGPSSVADVVSDMTRSSRRLSDRALQLVDEIRLFPREAAVGIRLAAEMAIGGGARIDRPIELEMLANAARASGS